MAEEKAKKAAASAEPKAPVKLTVKQIKEDLAAGIDRRGIAKKYGVPLSSVKEAFKHPDLKGLKVKNVAGIILVDDDGTELSGSTSASTDATTNDGAKSDETQASSTDAGKSASGEAPGSW